MIRTSNSLEQRLSHFSFILRPPFLSLAQTFALLDMSRESLRTEGIVAKRTAALDLLRGLGLASSHIGYTGKEGG